MVSMFPGVGASPGGAGVLYVAALGYYLTV